MNLMRTLEHKMYIINLICKKNILMDTIDNFHNSSYIVQRHMIFCIWNYLIRNHFHTLSR